MIEIDTRPVGRAGCSSDSPPVIQKQREEGVIQLGSWCPSVPRAGGFEFVAVRRLARDMLVYSYVDSAQPKSDLMVIPTSSVERLQPGSAPLSFHR